MASGIAVSLLISELVWAYVVWFNGAQPFSRDGLLLLLYYLLLFGSIGAGFAALGWLAGRIWPRINSDGLGPALVVAGRGSGCNCVPYLG